MPILSHRLINCFTYSWSGSLFIFWHITVTARNPFSDIWPHNADLGSISHRLATIHLLQTTTTDRQTTYCDIDVARQNCLDCKRSLAAALAMPNGMGSQSRHNSTLAN